MTLLNKHHAGIGFKPRVPKLMKSTSRIRGNSIALFPSAYSPTFIICLFCQVHICIAQMYMLEAGRVYERRALIIYEEYLVRMGAQ